MSTKLHLDGTPGTGLNSRRFRILVNKAELWLPYRLFSVLAKLARHRQTSRNEYLSADMIEPAPNHHKTIYVLRSRLNGSGLHIQSRYAKGYRLVDISTVKWDMKQIKKFPELMRLFGE